ncbi:MAG TPA: hypothetical protein PKC28_08690, partial [Bdellovibrionales bacterium]|nr:hypothetical protein [Bdellovibrionales bacterium]
AAAKSESAKPAASAAGEQCVTARPVACADLSDEERKLAGIRFRKAPGEAVCISGAFRQKYVGDKKVPGGCKPLGHIEFTSGKKECPKGATKQAACNPVVFCLKDKTKESGGLAMLCVDKKPGKNPPVTEMCDQKYELFLKVPMEKGSSEKRFENCDPTKITAKDLPEGLATASAYKEMVDATQNLADEWCVANADFQALNCRECATILKHIHAMNKEATGAGCVAENTAAPAGQMSPYAPDQGGEAPTAVPEGRKSGSTDDN